MPKQRENLTIRRRQLLEGICGLGVGFPVLGRTQTASESASLPPQEDDWLVFAFGERAGKPMTPENFIVGQQQIFAYPQDPATNQIRNGTRLNQLIVVRVPDDALSDETRARAADGIVAYSGVCSHTGCDVTDWNDEGSRFQCPCHESQFDPADSARVVGGPAPWQLAALPLKLKEGNLAAAGAFQGRLGFQQPGLDPFGLSL